MRIRISHTTTYRYETPPSSVTQTLRLTPRNDDNQYIVDWRLELSNDSQLTQQEDAFGNIIHTFTAISPGEELRINVEGVVDAQDSDGMVRGTIERFPVSLYLRPTPLSQPDDAITAFAEKCHQESEGDGRLALLHHMMHELHGEMTFDINPTQTTTTAAEAFAMRRGVCQDITHIFITAARVLRIPARYVGGYFHRADGVVMQDAGHAWAEAYINDLGWIAFDPTNGICTTAAHVRVAIGLDYLGAAPVRGARYGGSGESIDVTVAVEQSRQQMQN